MKRLMLLVIGLVLLVGMVSIARAATTANISVKVTVTAELSVSVDRDVYNFGDQDTAVTTISTYAIIVTNNSTESKESYKLNGSDTAENSWTLSAAPAEDAFELRAIFFGTTVTDAPVEANFDTGNDDLTTTAVYCSITQFAEDGGSTGEMGLNVDTGEVRYLWFLLNTPLTLTKGSGSEQTSTVTITAAFPE